MWYLCCLAGGSCVAVRGAKKSSRGWDGLVLWERWVTRDSLDSLGGFSSGWLVFGIERWGAWLPSQAGNSQTQATAKRSEKMLFCDVVSRLIDQAKIYLAWSSILDDFEKG